MLEMGISPWFYFPEEGIQERDFVPLNPGSTGVPHVPADLASSLGASPCPCTAFPGGAGIIDTGFVGIVGP